MKINWGTGIFIVIMIFMIACAVFFIFANRQDNSLVESDYYGKGLRYEEMLQKMRNTAALKELPLIRLEKEFLKIQYPHLMKGATYSGTVLLYRPSDKKYDRALTMVCDTAMVQLIPGNLLHKGKYIVKLDWVINDKSYYLEKEIFAE